MTYRRIVLALPILGVLNFAFAVYTRNGYAIALAAGVLLMVSVQAWLALKVAR